jgi:hypothetical protein
MFSTYVADACGAIIFDHTHTPNVWPFFLHL